MALFNPPIGSVVLSWSSDGRNLTVRVADVSNVNIDAPLIGVVTVSIVGVSSSDGLSMPCHTPPLLLTGDWGIPGPPAIVAVTAVNRGLQVLPPVVIFLAGV